MDKDTAAIGAHAELTSRSRRHPLCGILPPYLLERLAQSDDEQVRDSATQTAAADLAMRQRREARAERAAPQREPRGVVQPELLDRVRASRPADLRVVPEGVGADTATQPAVVTRAIHDAQHRTTLPGRLVREEGEPESSDESVNEAYAGLGATWELFHEAFGRDSLDGAGLELVASVHYGRRYDNAFWDGAQMVFGDGDGVIFNSFTDCLDVIGHELAHGVTQYTANLVYVGQSGALNESISDVFGSLVRQHSLGQSADQADWLIGAGLFTGSVRGVALRSMKAPGTAYDDPRLGKDPQPSDMDGFVDLPHDDAHDNGGVHTNSGIPNRAFYLTAAAIGGYAWEKAGRIWYNTLTGGTVPKDVDFAGFARATIASAVKLYGADDPAVGQVEAAWRAVKVLSAPMTEPARSKPKKRKPRRPPSTARNDD